MLQAGIKGGLVGGAIAAVLQFAGLIQCVGCFTCFLVYVVYVAAGVLAAYWLPIPRSAGDGAGAGALAGVLAGVIGGIFGMMASAVQFLFLDGSQAISQLPQEFWDMFGDMDIDPNMFASAEVTIGAVLISGTLCCVVGMVIAAVLGALGGAVFAAAKTD